MNTNKSKPGKPKGSSAWLQTFVVTGSLAATVVGAGLINRLAASKADAIDTGTTALQAGSVVLAPIPTVFVPLTANNVAIAMPTSTPVPAEQNNQSNAIMPTDTPVPTATSIVVQQSTQNQVVPRVRRRSRSSR